MVSSRVVFSLLVCLQCLLMVFWRNCLIVVLVVNWGSSFVGELAYADDVVLLAPCASALRCMLSICSTFASHHGLVFNAKKTQLICLELSNPTAFSLQFVLKMSH